MGRRHVHAYGALERVGRGALRARGRLRPSARGSRGDGRCRGDASRASARRSSPTTRSSIASGLVEALDVVTDPSVHHLVAVPALRAGLHVICEKPLGITVRACRVILEAAESSGAVLAVAENYRRDGPNRLARAVLEHGLLGEVHLMVEANVGGDDAVVISPWRHRRESGSIALDMGVHYTDIFAYYLGELETRLRLGLRRRAAAKGARRLAAPCRVSRRSRPA